MKSASAYTAEILDTQDAIRDLAGQIRAQLPDLAAGLGILFASPLYDWEEFLPGLSGELGIEIVGSTGVALLTARGYKDEGASLLVLSGEDCSHGIAIGRSVDHSESTEAAVAAAYDTAKARLGGLEPKLALFFATPQVERIDRHLAAFVAHTGGRVPLMGGLASDLFKFDTSCIIAEGSLHKDSFSLVLLAGDFNPLFEVGTVPHKKLALSTVTRAEGYVVREIDGRPAIEFLEKNDVRFTTQTSKQFCPICYKARDGKTIVPRDIRSVDTSTGEITLFGDLPEGTQIFIQSVTNLDLEKTATQCIDSLLNRVAERKTGEHCCILGASCAGRIMVLGPYKDIEGKVLAEKLPPHTSVAGFYAFGEICPLGTENGATLVDQPLLNLSIALCAL